MKKIVQTKRRKIININKQIRNLLGRYLFSAQIANFLTYSFTEISGKPNYFDISFGGTVAFSARPPELQPFFSAPPLRHYNLFFRTPPSPPTLPSLSAPAWAGPLAAGAGMEDGHPRGLRLLHPIDLRAFGVCAGVPRPHNQGMIGIGVQDT